VRTESVHIADDVGEESLFEAVNESHTGVITRDEFHKLYGRLHQEARSDIQKERDLELKANQFGRRLKLVSFFAITLFIFLACSVAANFAVVFMVVDGQVRKRPLIPPALPSSPLRPVQ
jgi:hypothetical protein